MLKTIIYKEILDNLHNLRFTLGSLLVIIVSFICVVVLTFNYKEDVKNYHQAVYEQNKALNEFAHPNRVGAMLHTYIPPSKFHPVVLGINQDAEIRNYNNNPLNILFPPFDFVIVVSILMSLLAIIFSYNTISGEAEDGTLRLILSNPVPRMLLLTGKWLGGIICIFIPFIISILLMSIYISISVVIQWSSYYWICFGILCLASFLFISIFYLIGLVVSCLTKNSTMSMLIGLFTWVLLILVIPNISPYFAAQMYKMPSVNRIEKEVRLLGGIERDELGRKLQNEAEERYKTQYSKEFALLRNVSPNELAAYLEQDADLKKIYTEMQKAFEEAWNTANQTQAKKINKILTDVKLKSEQQTTVAKNIAAVSPYSCFIYIATDITGTGLHKSKHDEQQIAEYREGFWNYFGKKNDAAQKENPLHNSDSFIDISDRPVFVYTEEPVSSKIAATRPYWVILLAFNGLLLILVYICFKRYDVR